MSMYRNAQGVEYLKEQCLKMHIIIPSFCVVLVESGISPAAPQVL